MKTPVNTKTIRHHLFYSWWKYALVIAAGIFLVDLMFTVTAPRIPNEKKVEFYIYGYANNAGLEEYMNRVHEEEMPDMESVTFNVMTLDSTYGPMQLTTYMAAGEGDLYLLSRDEFLSYAGGGAFYPLEDDEELMALFNENNKNLRRGWRTVSNTDETHLFGIPADLLPGLINYCYAEDGYLAVLLGGGNIENTMKFLRTLVSDTITAEEAETAEPVPDGSAAGG